MIKSNNLPSFGKNSKMTMSEFRQRLSAFAVLVLAEDSQELEQISKLELEELVNYFHEEATQEASQHLYVYSRPRTDMRQLKVVIEDQGRPKRFVLTVLLDDQVVTSCRCIYNNATQTLFSEDDRINVSGVLLEDDDDK